VSERTLKQLVGALVVVAAIWLVTRLLSGGGGGIEASGEIATLFEGMTPDAVQAVRMTGPDGTAELSRATGRWTVNGWDADGVQVSQLLNELRLMEVGDLVATNPANHQRMGVDDEGAVRVEVDVDGDTRTVLIGDQGPRFGTAYGRLPGEDDVYVLEGDLRTHARKSVDAWRDKEIVAVDTAAVGRIEIERDGTSYAVVRGDSVWTLEDGGDVDAIQVRNVLVELSSVVASGFLTEADSLFVAPPGASSRAYSSSGETLAEITIGSGEGERWARAVGDSVTYRLSTFRVGRLAPTLETMRGGS